MERFQQVIIGGLGASVLFLAGVVYQHSASMDENISMKLDVLSAKVSSLEARVEVQRVQIDDLKSRLDATKH